MNEVTITVSVGDWLDTPPSRSARLELLRSIADDALFLLCKSADDRGFAVHVKHSLED